jgi:hypothetical protein
MTKRLFSVLLAGGLSLPLSLPLAAPALAWSTGSAPTGGALSEQFSDPDEAVDNIANGAQGGGGTELSVGGLNQGNGASDGAISGAGAFGSSITVKNTNAEPVNPGWPLWMTWHQN